MLGSTTAVPSYGRAAAAAAASTGATAATTTAGDEAGTPAAAAEGDDQLAEGGAGAGGGERDGTAEYEQIPYEESELNKLVRLGISHAKRWDRQAKLKSADGREGWEKHLIGALCQRGGPVHMPNFVRIMRHLFRGHPALPKQDWYPGDDEEDDGAEDVKPKEQEAGEDAEMKPPSTTTGADKQDREPDDQQEQQEPPESSQLSDVDQLGTPPAADSPSAARGAGGGEYDAEAQYFTLALEDKLDIVAYLCTLVMGSKVVRSFVDESDARLTELRKAKADVNKEKKALCVYSSASSVLRLPVNRAG